MTPATCIWVPKFSETGMVKLLLGNGWFMQRLGCCFGKLVLYKQN